MELMELVRTAYKKVPMYVRLNVNIDTEDLEKYPLIEKNYVIDNEAGAISAEASSLYIHNKLLNSRTSGSTGKYMDIYWKESDYNKSMLPLWLLRKKYYGINTSDRLCFFFTILQTGDTEEDVITKEIHEDIVNQILRCQGYVRYMKICSGICLSGCYCNQV